MRHWWFSSDYATGYVCSGEENKIIETCPIWRKFVGQHIKKLADWLRKKGGFMFEELPQLTPNETADNIKPMGEL